MVVDSDKTIFTLEEIILDSLGQKMYIYVVTKENRR